MQTRTGGTEGLWLAWLGAGLVQEKKKIAVKDTYRSFEAVLCRMVKLKVFVRNTGRADSFFFDQVNDLLQQGLGFVRPGTGQHEQSFVFTDNRFVLTVAQVAQVGVCWQKGACRGEEG